MIRQFTVLFLSMLSFSLSAEQSVEHTQSGSHHEEGSESYYDAREWPFISLFLFPSFADELKNLEGQKVLDAGCGSGIFSAYAAQNGGQIYAIDMQPRMVEKAKRTMQGSDVSDQVELLVGDPADLPYQNAFFHKAMSVNVACHLSQDRFNNHFKELSRTLLQNGTAVVCAPASMEVVFIDGSKKEQEVLGQIAKVLGELSGDSDPFAITRSLNGLTDVLHATFVLKNNQLTLVTHQNQLEEGAVIWRKLPGGAVLHRYYSEQAYLTAFQEAELEIERVDHPHFASEEQRLAYNMHSPAKLGPECVTYAPYVTFHIKKAPKSPSTDLPPRLDDSVDIAQ